MRKIRDYEPPTEVWDTDEVMAHLNCTQQIAIDIMDECRQKKSLDGYGPIEKKIFLDFIEETQRLERERDARYRADIATAESFAVLKEQVKTLQKMLDSTSEDARKARIQAIIANGIAIASLVAALITLVR